MPVPSPLVGHEKTVKKKKKKKREREMFIFFLGSSHPQVTWAHHSLTNAYLLGHVWLLPTVNIKLYFKCKTSTASNSS